MDTNLKKEMDSSHQVNKAIYSSVVGRCMAILKDYVSSESEPSLDGFELFYLRTKGVKPLIISVNMVMKDGYSLQDSIDYVRIRVFDDTWTGFEWENKAKKYLLDEFGLKCRFANWEEDSKYCVDLIGKDFAIQVKPISYKLGSNPSLVRDRESHFAQHEKYEAKTGKRIGHVFYNKKTNQLNLERYGNNG